MGVEVRLLGGFQALIDGRRVPDASWSRRHPAALVKLLALAPGHRLLRDQVVDALWPDLLVEDAAPRLHKAAHYARAALGDKHAVVLAGDAVSLFPDRELLVDVDRFDALATVAVTAGDLLAAAEAVELYHGDLLPEDLYEPWTEQSRDELRLRYLHLLRTLGRWEQLVAADPADEAAHLELAARHLEQGDDRAALRQLDLMAEALERELGAVPGPAAQELRERASSAAATRVPGSTLHLDRRSPVPHPPTRTIGRDQDVVAVVTMLEGSRIVTLLGPGGVGKTRLAVEVALRWAETNAQEACFVDLTKVTDPGQVPELVASELGVRTDTVGGAVRALEEALRGRSLLLVLDNVEHVLEAAPVAVRLAGCSPGVHVLCTSRARLHVGGEAVFDVAPLPVGAMAARGAAADAIVLFAQVATAADPGFRLDDHLADVHEICREVDGLPLAIELAAGHVRTLPPVLLLARLRARLSSPVAGARDLPSRQRTIPATIDWSLQLLNDADRDLFTRLGVFAGPVGLDVVEQVCGDPAPPGSGDPAEDVLDGLTRLVDHSLVRRRSGRRGEPRFYLLELLRAGARERLATTEGDLVAARHAAFVADFLDDLDERRWTEAADRWIDLINDLLAEIRAAHEWATRNGQWPLAARITAGMGTFWHREGHHHQGREWVASALGHPEACDDLLLGRLLLASGFLEWARDQLRAREQWRTAGELFRAAGNDRYLAYSLALESGTHIGDETTYEEALRLCDEGIELARRVGERPLIAQALNVKGELVRVHGDDELARLAYQEGLELAWAAGDESHASVLLANLAYLADHAGDYAEALAFSHEALRLCWRLGRRMMAAWTISEMAGPELGLGRAERGAVLVGAADEALRILGVTRHPGDLSEHARVVTALRAALGDGDYERLYDEGARLSLEEAADLALDDSLGLPTRP